MRKLSCSNPLARRRLSFISAPAYTAVRYMWLCLNRLNVTRREERIYDGQTAYVLLMCRDSWVIFDMRWPGVCCEELICAVTAAVGILWSHVRLWHMFSLFWDLSTYRKGFCTFTAQLLLLTRSYLGMKYVSTKPCFTSVDTWHPVI